MKIELRECEAAELALALPQSWRSETSISLFKCGVKVSSVNRLRRDRPDLTVVHAETDRAVSAYQMLDKPSRRLDFPGETSLQEVLKYAAAHLPRKIHFTIDSQAFAKSGVKSLNDLKVRDVQLSAEPFEGALCQILDKVNGHMLTFEIGDDAIVITTAKEPNWKSRSARLDTLYGDDNEWLEYVLQQPVTGDSPKSTPLAEVLNWLEAYAFRKYGKDWKGSEWLFKFDIDPELRASGLELTQLKVNDVSFDGITVDEAIRLLLKKVTTQKLKYVIRYGKIVITK